ncbi:tRNA (adenosine(37)-N6)-threonylcarbamoyltransferase complex dimerization subunit type 1 TsaB [Sphingomonas sp. ASV193]|uniref:tRNA (adenosine(37)-N6)-threonylcarbamoyltransferase complex dimerization subunit type 1 TsaB n=1 Tax=Sphingomonas sp. ASV193 TaxID=3144405 RepID=UPI0032E8A264
MILALDTSTAACTAALIGPDGDVVARADELIGRGHDKRLAPMIAELLGGHVPSRILVGVGPGSFTGIRVGIACAEGLGIGWSVPVHGMNSLALVAAGGPPGSLLVAVAGGHGELFVQPFDAERRPTEAVASLAPAEAAARFPHLPVVGGGAAALVAARGEAGGGAGPELLPSAANALRLPVEEQSLPPRPAYARAPDAKARAA